MRSAADDQHRGGDGESERRPERVRHPLVRHRGDAARVRQQRRPRLRRLQDGGRRLARICMRTHERAHARTHARTSTQTQSHTRARTSTYIFARAPARAHTHTRTHALTHARTHVRTHARM